MNTHTDPQIIMQDGHPVFAVIPWDKYQKLLKKAEMESPDIWLPHEVVQAVAIEGLTLIKAWREHLGMTQAELAEKSSMSQPALARLEKSDANPRTATLKKLAEALNITPEQLSDD